ncbi:MAG: hypothetical protein Q4E41_09730 [Bacteroidales bacterium]|nr:hypothetical protein [Bacteroidales bacterium]
MDQEISDFWSKTEQKKGVSGVSGVFGDLGISCVPDNSGDNDVCQYSSININWMHRGDAPNWYMLPKGGLYLQCDD